MKIYLDTIGCRLNQSEIEKIGSQFRVAGHDLVGSPAEADIAVINTCTVTKAAASDSRKKARHAYRSGSPRIILTGCWATMDSAGAAALPGVTDVIANPDKEALVATILGLPQSDFDRQSLARQPLPGLRARTRAFIKAQDGCDNHCTFCITRLARGHSRSQSISQVIDDIQAAEQGNVQEIVLSGVHLASWGRDFSNPTTLPVLIKEIIKQTNIPRIRLSSLEPWGLEDSFFELWENPRMCRHLHLPLQSGSASILKRMGRHNTPESFARIVKLARQVSPEVAITTDIIVGFPGETDVDFNESLSFIERIQFAAGHVFSFSSRPGTPAAKLKNLNTKQIKKNRNSLLHEIFKKSSLRFRETQIGKTVSVLWEGSQQIDDSHWRLSGLTDHYIRVSTISEQPLYNQISRVTLQQITEDGMSGEIVQP